MNASNVQDVIFNLIAKNKLAEAIEVLKKHLSDRNDLKSWVIQSARYTDVIEQIHLNTIDYSLANIEKNKIRVALVELASEIDKQIEANPHLSIKSSQASSIVHQHHTGSGDNVGRDKIVNQFVSNQSLNNIEDLSKANWLEANIVDYVDNEPITLEQVYVERLIEKDIWHEIENEQSKLILIVGDAGNGKTSILWQIINKYEHHSDYSPLFIKSTQLTTIDIEALSNRKNVLLLIDTIDVLLNKGSDREQLIQQLLFFKKKGIRIVATTRVKEANTLNVYHSLLEIKKLFLNFYDKEQELPRAIRSYILKYLKYNLHKEQEEYYTTVIKAVNRGTSVLEICLNPLTLKMLFAIYRPKEIPSEINTFQLYNEFWKDKVEDDKRSSLNVMEQSSLNLASEAMIMSLLMLSEGKPQINHKIATQFIQQSVLSKLVTRNVLKYTSLSGEYSFFHQTFFEHVAAKALLWKLKKEALLELKQKTFVSNEQYRYMIDLFLLPVYEQFLLHLQYRYITQITIEIEENLLSDYQPLINSTLYVYSLLDIELDFRKETPLNFIKNNIANSTFLFKSACNFPDARIEILFKLLYVSWHSNQWKVKSNIYELLERFAVTQPERVLNFIKKNAVIEDFISHCRKIKAHRSEGINLVRALIQTIDIDKKYIVDSLILLLKEISDSSTNKEILFKFIKNYEALGEVNLPKMIENQIIQQDIYQEPKLKWQVFESVLLPLSDLWKVKLASTNFDIAHLINDYSQSNHPSINKIRLLTLGKIVDILNKSQCQYLINHYCSIDAKEEIIHWNKIFWKTIMEYYNNNNSNYSFMLNNIFNNIKQNINEITENTNSHNSDFAVIKCQSFLEAIFLSNFIENHTLYNAFLSNSKLLKQHELLNKTLLEKHIELGTKLFVILYLTYIKHSHSNSWNVNELRKLEHKFYRKIKGEFHKLALQNINAAILVLKLIIAEQDDQMLCSLTNKLARNIASSKTENANILQLLATRIIELERLCITFIYSKKEKQRQNGIRTLHNLIALDLALPPNLTIILDLLNAKVNMDTKIELLKLLKFYDLQGKEQNLTIEILNEYINHKGDTIKTIAQTEYIDIILANPNTKQELDLVWNIILDDFNLHYRQSKFEFMAKLIEEYLKMDSTEGIRRFIVFFKLPEIENISQRQLHKLPHSFKRCAVRIFEQASSIEQKEILDLLGRNEYLDRLIINTIFYNIYFYEEHKKTLFDFLNSDNIAVVTKKLILDQQKYRINSQNIRHWHELKELL